MLPFLSALALRVVLLRVGYGVNFGAMTALAFKAAIDDPKRFTSSTKVGPYLGLTPRQYQSGESEWFGGIGKTNDPLLRSYLCEVAGVLMTHVHRSCPLKMWAKRLAKRVGWKRASVAVARKLAIILHAIWRNGTEFEWQTTKGGPN